MIFPYTATIPLDRYPKPAADSIIFIFAIWGISQLLMAIVYLVILWKYRTLLPFGILLFTLEYVFRLLVSKGFLAGKTMATDGQAPGGIGNIIFVPIGAILFWNSLPILQ